MVEDKKSVKDRRDEGLRPRKEKQEKNVPCSSEKRNYFFLFP